MVKAFADAWFFTVETSNTSSRNKNHATVDAHVSVLYPNHTLFTIGRYVTIYTNSAWGEFLNQQKKIHTFGPKV